jgi:hypothetical protein
MGGWQRLSLVAAVPAALALAAITFAVHDAKARILQALGPRATVGDISLSYPHVVLRDVRIAADPAPGAWPAAEEFHAARVDVSISAASLWAFRRGEPLQVDEIAVADGALSVLHTRARFTILPSLRDASRTQSAALHASDPATTPAAPTAFVLRAIRFERMAVDLHDSTNPGGATQRLRFEGVHGNVADIALPTLDRPIALDLAGTLKGVEHDGGVTLRGRFTPAAHDIALALRATDVDMLALQPWLLHLGERPIRHGSLTLALDVRVADSQLHAPGEATLSGLEFDEAGDGGTFAGVERRAVLAALRRDGRVTLKFALDGRTDDPRFSLAEHLGGRIAAGLGQAVGNGVKDVVHGVGDALRGLIGRPAR